MDKRIIQISPVIEIEDNEKRENKHKSCLKLAEISLKCQFGHRKKMEQYVGIFKIY